MKYIFKSPIFSSLKLFTRPFLKDNIEKFEHLKTSFSSEINIFLLVYACFVNNIFCALTRQKNVRKENTNQKNFR